MSAAAESLATVADAFIAAGVIPEADWSKMRALEFQDALKARQALLRRQRKRSSPSSEGFAANVNFFFARVILLRYDSQADFFLDLLSLISTR